MHWLHELERFLGWVGTEGDRRCLRGDSCATFAGTYGVPVHFVQLLLLIEDKRFWMHRGVDPMALARASIMILRGVGRLQGGSTIIEQLLKGYVPGRRRTLLERFLRAVGALGTGIRWPRALLLARYLDTAYFGLRAFGLSAAAREYFNASRDSLTPAQSFFLAERIALPNAFRAARIRNLLRRPMISAVLGEEIARLPSVYERRFGFAAADTLTMLVQGRVRGTTPE
jgi:membrane peptidoglycan carboxypeptidase